MTHRSMAITDVNRMRIGKDALDTCPIRGNDQIVAAQVERLDGIGQQAHQRAIHTLDGRDSLKKGTLDRASRELCRDAGLFIKKREEICVRVNLANNSINFFSAPVGGIPRDNNCNPHIRIS
jgi:hypothetical protein